VNGTISTIIPVPMMNGTIFVSTRMFLPPTDYEHELNRYNFYEHELNCPTFEHLVHL